MSSPSSAPPLDVSIRDALGRHLGFGFVLLALAVLGPAPAQGQESEFAREDPAKIVSATTCGECHLSEMEVWKKTPHATGFRTLHRKESAEAIASKMGFRLVKRESICIRCHFTPTVKDEQVRAVSGVSCESCHGAAAEWIEVHNNYGQGYDRGTEPEAHRQARIERSRALGMRRPSDLLPVVASCYGCHTVPEERLVNVGGHSTGSGTFELVSWHEKIRHNFLDSFISGDGTENAEPTTEHLRVLYVVGRALALEFGVRGLAAATGPGIYSQAMSRRVRIALSEVRAINSRSRLDEVDAIVAAVRGVRMVPNNQSELLKAADLIRAATEDFVKRHDGARLASLDGLVRGEEDAEEGEDQLADSSGGGALGVGSSVGEDASGTGDGATGAVAETSGTATPESSGGGGSGATGGGAAAAKPAAPTVVGKRKQKIRPASSHRTLGPSACSGCHGEQNGWWFGDRHFAAADPFFDRQPKNVQIARLYGISPSDMLRGNQVCMDCHGSVISGKEKREVQDGVGCESCHGAAADWLEPHKDESGKELGPSRPGYVAAVAAGKTDLRDLNVRARTCTGCHYITEPRLISAGHPSGKEFDYLAGLEKVKHWDRPLEAPAQSRAAFATALGRRGGVPAVPVARLASSGGAGPAGSSGGRAGAAGSTGDRPAPPGGSSRSGFDSAGGGQSGEAATGGGRSSTGDEVGPSATDAIAAGEASRGTVSAGLLPSGSVPLDAFPEIGPDTTLEDLLLIIKHRIEKLYGSGGPP